MHIQLKVLNIDKFIILTLMLYDLIFSIHPPTIYTSSIDVPMYVNFIHLLQDCTIRSCDFDTEQTWVLHSPEKKMERITIDTEVHLALTPLQPVVFFGFHRRMSVTGLLLFISFHL